jgi:hypothetical protein
MHYEGHDKHYQFVTQLQAIKADLGDLCDGAGMELHGTIYTFKLVVGGNMAFQGRAFEHDGAASTFVCFICDITRQRTSTSPHPITRERALHRPWRIHQSLQPCLRTRSERSMG